MKQLVLLVVFCIAGCQSMETGYNFGRDRPMSICLKENIDTVKNVITKKLRQDYLVSEEGMALVVNTDPYDALVSGLFGFGPIWQEKIIYHVVFVPKNYAKNHDDFSLNGVASCADLDYIWIRVEVVERQSAEFPWRVKRGSAIKDSEINNFLKNLQNMVNERDVSEKS